MFSESPFLNECLDLGQGEKTLKYQLSMLAKKMIAKFNLDRDFIFPSYKGGLRPAQLYVIMKSLYESPSDELVIAEVGIARGISSVFLAEAAKSSGKFFNYYAIDTFSGFDAESVERERQFHGDKYSWNNYDYLDYGAYVRSCKSKKIPIQLVKHTDYLGLLEDTLFDAVILDVDTEIATLEYLNFFHPRLKRNGVLLVDDACEDNKYDGALRAYRYFCGQKKLRELYLNPKSALLFGEN